MSSQMNKEWKLILHPYIFVLKEGREINHNFLDYSLQILQVGCVETIRSPKTMKRGNAFVQTSRKRPFASLD